MMPFSPPGARLIRLVLKTTNTPTRSVVGNRSSSSTPRTLPAHDSGSSRTSLIGRMRRSRDSHRSMSERRLCRCPVHNSHGSGNELSVTYTFFAITMISG